jgi:hypothetical protein
MQRVGCLNSLGEFEELENSSILSIPRKFSQGLCIVDAKGRGSMATPGQRGGHWNL